MRYQGNDYSVLKFPRVKNYWHAHSNHLLRTKNGHLRSSESRKLFRPDKKVWCSVWSQRRCLSHKYIRALRHCNRNEGQTNTMKCSSLLKYRTILLCPFSSLAMYLLVITYYTLRVYKNKRKLSQTYLTVMASISFHCCYCCYCFNYLKVKNGQYRWL